MMKLITCLFVFAITLTVSQFAAATEDRGGHCQPPSCFGARGPFNTCAGKWVCSLRHDRYDRKELDPKYICLREGSSPQTKCKDGKEVIEPTAAAEAEEDAA